MKSLKVFFACALGAFIGALVALQVNHNFWWVGMIAGFVTGYLAYEFKAIIHAAPRAWNAATNWSPDWKTFKEGCIAIGIFVAGADVALMTASLFLVPNLMTQHVLNNQRPFASIAIVTAVAASLGTVSATLSGLMMGVGSSSSRDVLREMGLQALRYANPVGVVLGMIWLLMRSPAAAKVVGRFLRNLFVLTHSDARLLCGIDAAIGAAIGYHFHSVLFAAAVGGLLGVFNFEVFSIRVLHLVPVSASVFNRK